MIYGEKFIRRIRKTFIAFFDGAIELWPSRIIEDRRDN